jgi:hypothetical protein
MTTRAAILASLLFLSLTRCGSNDSATGAGGAASTSSTSTSTSVASSSSSSTGGVEPYQQVFDAVTEDGLRARMREVTGVDKVTVNKQTFAMTDRWSADAKARFRDYYRSYFEALGATVNVIPFQATNLVAGETEGHNIEAVLPGDSADTVVILVHYDSVGIDGKETENPGADDDGSGLVMLLEAAKIFASAKHRHNTVRFVAADYEEISDNLDGDYAYVKYLVDKSKSESFKILVASDNDQTGWSCWDEDPSLCTSVGSKIQANSVFKLITCSGDKLGYDYPDLKTGFQDVAKAYPTSISPYPICDGAGDTDHYAFWAAGIPAYVIEEWGSESNPHYDDKGGDTIEKISFKNLTGIAKLQITFQAKLIGLE